MKTKLTTCETRAKRFCESLNANKGGTITVEWKRSATWGANPSIDYMGKCCNVSGCGYCKLSTALAETLRFLFPVDSEPYNQIWQTGGAGEGRTMSVLASLGYKLDKVTSGKTYDVYTLSVA